MSSSASTATSVASGNPRWYEVLLGLLLVAALVAIAITLVVRLAGTDPQALDSAATAVAESSQGEWRDGGRSVGFLVVMLAGGAVALVAFLVAMLRRTASNRAAHARAVQSVGSVASIGSADGVNDPLDNPAAAQLRIEPRAMPMGGRIVGLLLPVAGLLLLAWAALSSAEQRALVTVVLYPASFAMALVLMFDKASRAWHYKSAAESFREWLLCDLFMVLLVLGFLNTWRQPPEFEYASTFFDLLHIVLFLAVVLLLDRGRGRYRFLLGYAYLLVLPLMLWAWRAASGVGAGEDAEGVQIGAWSATLWPFVILGVVYFVLEVIALLASRAHFVPAVKDALAIVVYVGFLLAALPEPA